MYKCDAYLRRIAPYLLAYSYCNLFQMTPAYKTEFFLLRSQLKKSSEGIDYTPWYIHQSSKLCLFLDIYLLVLHSLAHPLKIVVL